MNVLFLASWYPNPEQPQNGNFIERHAQAVGRLATVAVLYVHSSHEVSDYNIQISKNKHITECRVYFPKTSALRPFAKIRNYKKAHWQGFNKLVALFGTFDICHLNVFYPAGIFAAELKKKVNLPFIITEHWTKFLPIHPARFNPHEKMVIRQTGNAAKMICPVSEDLKNAIHPMLNHNRFEVIPNVVDTDLFTVRTSRSADRPIRILHISTLNDHHKNTTGMLRVLARLHQQRTDFTVTMIGNHYGDKYINMAHKLGLPSTHIEILPEIPLEEIAAQMPLHDIFLLFSHFENLPCVISEALVCGLSVVASDVGGIREMITPENGKLVTAGDEAGLLTTLDTMMNNLDNYTPQTISSSARQRYGYDAVGRAFLKLYTAP